MDRIAAADVDAAVDEMVGLLAPHADGDWSTPAGTLEWSCWATAAHVAHDLAAYAAQLAARATDGYLPFALVVEAGATPRDVLSVVAASGRLLSAAESALPAGRRPPAPRCGRRRRGYSPALGHRPRRPSRSVAGGFVGVARRCSVSTIGCPTACDPSGSRRARR